MNDSPPGALASPAFERNRFRVDALDVSAPLLARARAGVYGAFSFRAGDLGCRARYFTRLGGSDELWELSPDVRETVRFVRDNLLAPVRLGGDGAFSSFADRRSASRFAD